MPTISKNIKHRRSYRSYSDKPIEQEKIEAVLEAAMYAPSAHHKRGWEFVLVTDQDKIDQLAKTTRWSDHVGQAQAVIVVCSPEWENWLEDASIVSAHIYLEATNQGLGTCWTQVRKGARLDGQDAEEYVRQVLSIPEKMRVLSLMPLGYPAQDKSAHDSSDYEAEKVHQDQW
jgi:nitroreductase